MSSYAADFAWQRRFLPEVKRALAEHLIVEAPFEEDAHRNTDLMVLQARNLRIACRIRKHTYLVRYPNQFTIRAGRPSGALTELGKVVSGWGDYLFYGFAGPDERGLAAWLLGDLSVFRLWFSTKLAGGVRPGTALTNRDGTTFRAFRVDELPGEFLRERVTSAVPA